MLALNTVLNLLEDEISSVKQISSNVVKVSFFGGKSTLCVIKPVEQIGVACYATNKTIETKKESILRFY